MRFRRIEPGPGQESVWDYPRPPRMEDSPKRLTVVFNGVTIVDTHRAKRILETSHPPTYYIPPEDIKMEYLKPVGGRSFCEWKGQASYYDVVVNGKNAGRAAWAYPSPSASFATLKDHVSFYAHMMDECTVDGEKVQAQAGDFYGGWITNDIVGPFKGGPGTMGW